MLNFDINVLDNSEKLIFALRTLYTKHGYQPFHMSKFEEYDLYGRNKDFLISDRVITFTDTDGKLMALKPDVTLSIVKNSRDDPDRNNKLCYNENVYRVSGTNGTFRELMQTGIECIGSVDNTCIREVLVLAAESLNIHSENFVLELSHLGILMELISRITDSEELKNALIGCAAAKNIHGITELLCSHGIDTDKAGDLLSLLKLSGSAKDVLPVLETICTTDSLREYYSDFKDSIHTVCSTFQKKVRIDFSLTADINYYNGIVFKGFIDGISESVLSGGQYDRLMKKLGKHSHAIGFAVYLDRLF